MTSIALRDRATIPQKYKWNDESLFPTPEDWENAYENLLKRLPELQKYQGRLAESPDTLLAWLDEYQDVFRIVGQLMVYSSMEYSVDTTNQPAVSRAGRVRGIFSQAAAATAFSDPEISAIGFDTLRAWMKADPRLAIYDHYIDKLEAQQPHIRSAEVEELLGQVMDPFRAAGMIHSTLADTDLHFKPAVGSDGQEIEIAQGTIGALLTHPDREVRRTAWENYADGYLEAKNTFANCLSAGVKQDVFVAKARRYASSLHAALTPNHIPVEVFHNLVNTFKNNLHVWHRYWDFRKSALGYEKFHVYDVKAPLTEGKVDIPYEQALEWIVEGMAPLGDNYLSKLKKGVYEQRWVDVYPNRGKRSGAFSSGSKDTQPFIMMSYNDDVFGLSTLAHELGHSMHSYLSWRNQPFVYGRYSLFAAEVASNFNQALVRAHLLKKLDSTEMQIAILEEAMSNYHRYLFVMPTLARFELEIHERAERGRTLTAGALMDLMAELFTEAFGPGVDIDYERVGITWAQFPIHMYMNFYVYQYATGIAGAHSLAQGILSKKEGAVDRYLGFLKAGGSKYPLDALRDAGVDMSRPEPVEITYKMLDEMVSKLEQLVPARA
jgi:oligoendopeptidase F